MNDAVESFLLLRLPIIGLVAYSVQTPNRALATQCLAESFSSPVVERMMTSLVQMGRTHLPAGQRPARYCWTFESLLVYVASRADGTCLALMVENKPGVQMTRVEEMLQGFLELAEL